MFINSKGYDVKTAPRGFSNGKLASISKLENRVLVTNDKHFTDSSIFPREYIFSVIWLKIPQDKLDSLLTSFSELLKKLKDSEDFEGKLIVLKEQELEILEIPSLSQAA